MLPLKNWAALYYFFCIQNNNNIIIIISFVAATLTTPQPKAKSTAATTATTKRNAFYKNTWLLIDINMFFINIRKKKRNINWKKKKTTENKAYWTTHIKNERKKNTSNWKWNNSKTQTFAHKLVCLGHIRNIEVCKCVHMLFNMHTHTHTKFQ